MLFVAFLADKLDGRPKEQISSILKTPSTITTATLSPAHRQRTERLLQKCAQYYKVETRENDFYIVVLCLVSRDFCENLL